MSHAMKRIFVLLKISIILKKRYVRLILILSIFTGSSIWFISKYIWHQIGFRKLSKCCKRLEAYDGHVMKANGKFYLVLEFENKFQTCELVVSCVCYFQVKVFYLPLKV